MSTQRTMSGGWTDRGNLPRGPNGRHLCRWCSLEVPKGRLTFCSAWCVEEWRLRTDPGYLREKVLERDRGVCASCGVDCLDAERHLKRLRGAARLKASLAWGLGPGSRKSLWDADHIVPVVEGGGECDLQNLRTLCLKCHRAATAELGRRRRSMGQTPSDVGQTPPSAPDPRSGCAIAQATEADEGVGRGSGEPPHLSGSGEPPHLNGAAASDSA